MNDIDSLASKEEELLSLVKKLNEAFSRYSIEINVEKAKLITNNERRLSIKSVLRNLTEPRY